MTAPYVPPTIPPEQLTTDFPLAHVDHLATTGTDALPLWLLALGVFFAGMISLSIAGLRQQLYENRMRRLAEEADEKHEQQLARRRWLYALKHLPRHRISTTTYRGDL